jgi:CBS domain-containing protein
LPAQPRELLKSHPFQRFPVLREGKPVGVLTRKEAEAALAENRAPKLEPLVSCLPHHTIGDLQHKLIDSTSLMVLVLDEPGGRLIAVVTLHDLLRAEVSIAKGSLV